MPGTVWLTSDLVRAIHERQLKLFGGPPGLRDEGALESALGRPVNRAADGNERAALLGLVTFLGLNDVDVLVDEAEAVVMIRHLAAGEIDEAGITRWIRDNWPVA